MSRYSRHYNTEELFQAVARLAREDQKRALDRWAALTPQERLDRMRAEIKAVKEHEQS
jgi:acyl-CoA reductase-like NAD-dependent aldehyde dehydrogenase